MNINIRKIVISFSVLLLLTGTGIYIKKKMAAKKKPPIQRSKSQNGKRNILATTVQYKDHSIDIHSQGRVHSNQIVNLSSEVQGKIITTGIELREGAIFQQGQLLVQVDNSTAKLRLQSAKSDFIRSISSILADLKIDYPQSYPQWQEYFNKLDTEKPLPKLPKIKNSQEKVFIANKNIDKLFYSIKSDEEQLQKYNLYAPFTGVVKTVFAQKGSLVNPNGKIIEMISTEKFEVRLPVAEVYNTHINIGQNITLRTEDNKGSWKAKIVRKGAFINTNTQSIDIYAEIIGSSKGLIEGTYLTTNINSSSISNVMEINRKAVHNEEVYVISNDSTLSLSPINVVQKKENSVLFNGLEPGQQIVTEPLTNVLPNEKVSIRK